ncbi:hypothetical protein ACH5RR_014716 [Cinchona calisaya]|uniref:Uncharacterized protein n=1 Tax=Cinchona calisaya TaxID=153742 RepID=A0ABD2ZUN7_9GENT
MWSGIAFGNAFLLACSFTSDVKEKARRCLESALGGKNTEFEKWDKEEAGGGGDSSDGGWFRWFGGSNGDHFWQEAQQTSLIILCIIALFLIIAKGDMMLAVVLNPLLFVLRGTRNGLTLLTSLATEKLNLASNANFSSIPHQQISAHFSSRDIVVKKWGSD